MHLGRPYPYLWEFWQCEHFFWPGFVPRKIVVSCPLGYGTSWDKLNPGIVSEIGVPDAFSVGDPGWTHFDTPGDFIMNVLIHKVDDTPKRWSFAVQMIEIGVAISSVAYGDMVGVGYEFGSPIFTNVTTYPPYSLGLVPPIVVRAATWSEM